MNDFDPDAWRSWDAKSQAALASKLDAALGTEPARVWFCDRGRKCDGKPHGKYDYPHARGQQWPPPGTNWTTWLVNGGRGGGKTQLGSQYTRKINEKVERSIIIGPTVNHVRDVMVEGPSGILAAFDAAKVRVEWEPSKRRITNLVNGHIIYTFTGEEPERLRGPNSGFLWLDEPAHMPLIQTVWDNAMLGLRIGTRPHALCTTTPLPIEWMRELAADPDTVTVVITTYDNLDNLAPTFRKAVLKKYEGTRLGRQELMGEIIEDVEGALWTHAMIEDHRVEISHTEMDRISIGIDPSGTESKKRDETGIIAVGRKGSDLYVLDDVSGHYSPDGWARAAWGLYDKLGADEIVAEKNYGGEMVRSTLTNTRRDMSGGRSILDRVELVNSRRGKQLRAEPIVGLYEQGRVHHTQVFATLETQQTTWVPGFGPSPDRVDALVHAATSVAEGTGGPITIHVPRGRFDTALATREGYPTSVWSSAMGR